jgi:GTP cyclohydrolase II
MHGVMKKVKRDFKHNGKSSLSSRTVLVPEETGEERPSELSIVPGVRFVARALLPTRYGSFTIFGFHDENETKEITALVKGDVAGREGCPVRVHSECHTGDVFCSLRCDCREQLEASMEYIGTQPFGLLIYLRQEGRGIGLLNKIKAYNLQDNGMDTVEANEFLGFPEDAREYTVAAKVISILGIRSVSLLTNNPEKISGLEHAGVNVIGRIPLIIEPNSYNRRYLQTKKKKMGHLL